MKTVSICLLAAFCSLFLLNDLQAKKEPEPAEQRLNLKQVQAGVMSFADSWAALTTVGADVLAAGINTPEASLHAKKLQFYSLTAAYDIASGPYPGVAMLDMMVFASLSNRLWQTHWLPEYGHPAQQLADTYQNLEKDIWGFGAGFLKPEQLDEIRKLIDQWLATYPEVKAAGFIRFSDFGELVGGSSIGEAIKPGGFLSPVRDAAAAAEDIQDMGERAIFLGVRMQELVAGRFDLTVAETLQTPEIRQLLDDISGFRRTAEEYAVIMDTMPGEVAGEMDALVTSSLLKVTAERQAMIEQIMSSVSQERAVAIEQLIVSISEERAAALKQTLGGVETERRAVLHAMTEMVIWGNLQAKALFSRIFFLSASLILMYFLLRLVFRHMRERAATTIGGVLTTVALLFITAIPLIVIGVVFVEFTEPDMERIEALETSLAEE